jgi:uncharacterized protein YbjT (DUF2867 family)
MTATDYRSSPARPRARGKRRIVIVGASGMVGGYALRYALADSAVERVTSIGRQTLGISSTKLTQVVHRDFGDCSALADVLKSQDAVVFCLGTYTGSVPDAEMRRITVDYTVEFARVLHASSPGAQFSFLSGKGADQTGRSRIAFARYKGAAENALMKAGFSHVFLFRPSYIYPVEPRKEPNLSYRLLRSVYPVFRVIFPNESVRADDLGRAMVDVVTHGTEQRGVSVLENQDIQAMAKSFQTTGAR